MRRGTTPTLTINVGQDLSSWECILTLSCPSSKIDISGDRLIFDGEDIKATLTQEETLSLNGHIEIQIRAIKDGIAIASDIYSTYIDRILKEGVIGDGA